jgi:hypothetical protein
MLGVSENCSALTLGLSRPREGERGNVSSVLYEGGERYVVVEDGEMSSTAGVATRDIWRVERYSRVGEGHTLGLSTVVHQPRRQTLEGLESVKPETGR